MKLFASLIITLLFFVSQNIQAQTIVGNYTQTYLGNGGIQFTRHLEITPTQNGFKATFSDRETHSQNQEKTPLNNLKYSKQNLTIEFDWNEKHQIAILIPLCENKMMIQWGDFLLKNSECR